ncbi:MAG: flagellar biosynthesis protein FlhA [Planctomycetota bacterium]|jgi:flagellar biosynthesis protein FlhA
MDATQNTGGRGQGSTQNNALAFLMIGVLAVMLIPMPPVVLDILLTLNMSIALLVLIGVMNSSRSSDFSSFPTVLLFTALIRLSLNVASTRLILLDGNAGQIISAFGKYVIGGSYVVGVIIFLILVVIQFIVITKGQNRISEVAARFTLDALPGKQMSIDADLNAGLITNDEAKARRKELQEEAHFYGSMDGAGKFVRGDAIAGLIITAINIVGGIVLGVVFKGMPFTDAAQTYTVLTIGDGLVAQIPGLIISVGAGILVTKSTKNIGLQTELGGQVLGRPSTLRTVGMILLLIGLLPGMPFMAFLIIASLFFLQSSRAAIDPGAEAAAAEAEAADRKDEDGAPVEELLTVDRLGIEIGYRLITLVEAGTKGGLLDHIRAVRRQFASNQGVLVPPIRVKDNIQLQPNDYRIMLNGQMLGTGEVRPGHYLAMDPSGTAGPIQGIETTEPAFGLRATWIAESEKDKAEIQGYTVIDAPSVLVTHLSELLKKHSHELLSRDDVKQLVDNLKTHSPAVVDELLPNQMTLGQVQQVLARLLREQVPIRNLQTILECLSDSIVETKDINALTEKVRARISRTILEPYVGSDDTLFAAVIEPNLERSLADAVAGSQGVQQLPPGFLARFVESTANALASMVKDGREPVVITRSSLRPFLAEAVAGTIPNAAVLSYQETSSATKVETVARIEVPLTPTGP